MKRVIGTLLLSVLATPVFAAGGDWTGHISLFDGEKSLDVNDWKGSAHEQDSWGVITDFKRQDWPVSIAIDVMGSVEENNSGSIRKKDQTGEFDIGVRKIWSLPSLLLSPYIGGGVAIAYAEKESNEGGINTIQRDHANGIWVGVGTYWNITDLFVVGLDMRYTQAEVEIAGKDVDAGGVNAGFTLGLNW
ncbi:outer membrane protein [Marinomonas transparens]|uniref:Outer membrane beta-barrel protein n=1 Tax=Marinomonas transparens TaxID=2795388 RepID=A0A934JZ58_9GAMM|nr:outer membrane beta-barrel protein [Marinomonas transparens]MBJ7539592.1 outer membrane beta-barrel protein [Marinomonas transparens]